jgi:formate hydrogenlyase subunit 6/NADH:ubiquinone oxidoreductase subunit I
MEYVVDGIQCPSCNRCLDPCPVDTIVPMDDPRAVHVRDSNKPFAVDDWRSLLADQATKGEAR